MSCVHVDISFIRPTARYGEKRVNFIRSHVRTQNSWLLHLAGDFHGSYENKQVLHSPHLMRCMLSSNLAVDQRFANGTQGRLLHWGPDAESSRKAAVPANHPDLGARFVKDKQPGKDLPSPHALESCTFRNISLRAPPPPSCSLLEESAVRKRGTLLPDIDVVGVDSRQENLAVRGEPIMLQL